MSAPQYCSRAVPGSQLQACESHRSSEHHGCRRLFAWPVTLRTRVVRGVNVVAARGLMRSMQSGLQLRELDNAVEVAVVGIGRIVTEGSLGGFVEEAEAFGAGLVPVFGSHRTYMY